MDELNKFLKILRRYIVVLLVIPIAAIIITYFLVRNQPNSYMSQSQIATGIVDETKQYQQLSILNQSMLQGEQVRQEFSNLIAQIKMKMLLDRVSYLLIINDLTSKAYLKRPSNILKTLNKDARLHALSVYKEMYSQKAELNSIDPDQNGLIEVLRSMGYDSDNLNSKLNVFRSGDSDFITIQFESESPNFSAFVVNTLAKEFIEYYSEVVRTNKIKATNFLGELVKAKGDSLTRRMASLRDYKIKNRVLNLDEQSKQLYSSIVEYDNQKQTAVQNTASYAGALNEIDRKFSPGERKYLEATVSRINQDIVGTKQQLSAMYDLFYTNDFDEQYKTSIDSLNTILNSEISNSSDQYLNNPLAAKQSLVQQKIDLEIKLDISRYSINALERKLDKLNAEFDLLVPKEAVVQSYEMEIEIATKEYMDVLTKYNQSSLESGISVKLNIVQMGMPGGAQPSKRMLLVILSAVISEIFCLLILFVVFLLDRSVVSSQQLADKTGIPVLGCITDLNLASVDLKEIWTEDQLPPAQMTLRNELRSLRYEIENAMDGKVLLVNSLVPDQGKTFLTMSLSFAWLMTNKKVLIIDGNFKNPKISTLSNSSIFVEDFLQGKIDFEANTVESLTILNNRGGDASLIEVATYDQINERLKIAKKLFDLIIIETASLDILNQSKEWFTFTDNIIGIFKHGRNLNQKREAYITVLQKTGIFIGWIMNKVPENK